MEKRGLRPWGLFTIAATMPIAVLMGLYLRYWRPGKVLECSAIGFVLTISSYIARLYAEGVPVAGVDRLRLNAPLGVQDLLAAIRFVLQPDDDLALASLLVSPLLGWSQDRLMGAAPRGSGSRTPGRRCSRARSPVLPSPTPASATCEKCNTATHNATRTSPHAPVSTPPPAAAPATRPKEYPPPSSHPRTDPSAQSSE